MLFLDIVMFRDIDPTHVPTVDITDASWQEATETNYSGRDPL